MNKLRARCTWPFPTFLSPRGSGLPNRQHDAIQSLASRQPCPGVTTDVDALGITLPVFALEAK